jgi:integrase
MTRLKRASRTGTITNGSGPTGKRRRKAVQAGPAKASTMSPVPAQPEAQKELRPLHPEDVPAFLKAAGGRRLEALPVVALDSGARLGELLALEWSDWNPATRELSITKYLKRVKGKPVVRPTKTASSRRKVQLSAAAATMLESRRARMIAEGHGEAPVFCTGSGRHNWPSNVQVHLLNYVTKEAGLPHMRFRDLRHSCATLLLLSGVDIKTIAARLGHANPRRLLTTYAHVLPAMHGRAAQVMDGFLGGAVPSEGPAPLQAGEGFRVVG